MAHLGYFIFSGISGLVAHAGRHNLRTTLPNCRGNVTLRLRCRHGVRRGSPHKRKKSSEIEKLVFSIEPGGLSLAPTMSHSHPSNAHFHEITVTRTPLLQNPDLGDAENRLRFSCDVSAANFCDLHLCLCLCGVVWGWVCVHVCVCVCIVGGRVDVFVCVCV